MGDIGGDDRKNSDYYSTRVIKEGTVYSAYKGDGTLVSSSTTCETVIQAALNLTGDVILGGSDLTNNELALSAGFAGPLDILSDTNLVISKNCNITVAQGFTGTVFRIKDDKYQINIDFSGYIYERGTPSRLWTAFLYEASAGTGVAYNFFNGKGGLVSHAGVVLEIKSTSTGFVNANRWNDLYADQFIIGIKFNQISSGSIIDNVFLDSIMQCATYSTNVIKNVAGDRNMFVGCYVWDLPGGAKGMDILSTATNITIIGGYPSLAGGDDLSTTTIHLYPGHAPEVINPANTFAYKYVPSAIAANRNITLPLLTGNDTFVFEAHTQTLTNKTISGASNTISAIPDTALSANVAKLDAVQVFTNFNKFVNGAIQTFNPSGTFSYNLLGSAITNYRNITLPLLTGDDIFVFEAMAQPLTNKTINVRSNTFLNNAGNPLVKRWGAFQTAGGTTATTIGNLTGVLGSHVGTGAGTNTVTYDTTEGAISNFIATATGNLNIGLVSPTGGPICRRLFGCKMTARVKIDSTTSARMYVGFASAALAISDTPIATGVDGVMVGFTSIATNFEIYSNDNSGAMTTTAITGPIAKNANWHTIEINWTASGNVDVIFDGTTQTLSANIPLTTTSLFFNCVGQTTTTTARTFSIHDVWIEVDK